MRPSLLTLFLLFFALAFFGYAYLLSSAVALCAGAGVLIFVFFRAYQFGNLMQNTFQNISINRSADKTYLRQGAEVFVKVSVTLPKPEDIFVNIKDLPPEGTYVTGGNTEFSNGSAEYAISVMMLGTTEFRGIEVFLKDAFFEGKFRLAKGMKEPKLKTYPTGISATLLDKDYTSKMSSLEHDRLAVISGGDVRLFRPYKSGDSYKDIDWKLSAKHDDLIVKEHMDATGVHPLVIADLPEAGTPAEDVLKFTEIFTGTLQILNKSGGCPVAFISGGNLIGMDHSENESGVYDYLRTAGKVHRPFHQFRFRHTGSMRNEVAILESSDTVFSEKLRDVLTGHFARHPLPYEEGMQQLIANDSVLTDVIFLTNAAGDISHLTEAATEAKLQRKTVAVILPKKIWSDDVKIRETFHMAGADYVELV